MSFKAFKKQRNLCTRILWQAKFDNFNNLKESDLTDVRKFWNVIKPISSGNSSNNEITLVENNTIIYNDEDIANIFVDFFSNVVSNLNIQFEDKFATYDGVIKDPIEVPILVYDNHPSVSKIKENKKDDDKFYFSEVSVESIFHEI